MARVEKLSLPTQPKKVEKKPFARTLPGRLSAAIFGVTIGLGGGTAIENVIDQNAPQPTPITDQSPRPTETAIPTQTVAPTPEATKTPPPTEAPKFVYWTKDQIEKAEQNALLNNKILYADTWSEIGGKAQDAKTYNDHTIVVIDGLTKDGVFQSPTDGKVLSVSTEKGRNFSLYSIQVKINNTTVSYYFSIDSEPQVKPGENITVGSPLVKLSGELIPKGMLFSKPGEVAIANETSFSTTTQDILTDTNGLTVRLQTAPK